MLNSFLTKLLLSVLLVLLIYFWNKFVPKRLIRGATNFHKKHNKGALNTNPVRFVVKNEAKLIKGMQVFYWMAALLILLGIWLQFII
jgi:hypothetical protein